MYIGIIVSLAIVLFIYLIPSLSFSPDMWLIFIFFLTISAFAEFIPVNLPMAGSITIAFPIDFLLILVHGPALAMLIAALGALIGETIERKISWDKVIFNASQYALTAGIAGIAYQQAGGVVGAQNIFRFILPATICALTYCIVNITLFVIVVSFAQNVRIKTIWRTSIKETVPSY